MEQKNAGTGRQANIQPKRKNNLFQKMFPIAAAAFLSFSSPAFPQNIDTVLARGREILVVSGKDTLPVGKWEKIAPGFGLDSIPEKHKVMRNSYPSGSSEYYIMSKGTKGAIVVYWNPEDERYAAEVLEYGKDTSGICSAIMQPGKGLVVVKGRSILISNENGLYAADLDSAAQKYGEIGDIMLYAPKSGLLHVYPLGWLGKAWLLVDSENAAVRVKKMKIKTKQPCPQLIEI